MDILHLVDRLEQLLNDSRRLPLTSSLVVDEDRIYHLLDQMRVTIPDAVKRAGRVEAERERILAQSKEEAQRVRELAKQEASDLVNRDNIVANAHSRADNILERARRDADRMRNEADQYSLRVLGQLEQDLTRSLAVVRNGINMLEYNRSDDEPEVEEPAEQLESAEAMAESAAATD